MRRIVIGLFVFVAGCYGSEGDIASTGDAPDAAGAPGGTCGAITMDLSGTPRCERIPMPAGVMTCAPGAAPIAATRVVVENPAGARVSVAVQYATTESVGIARMVDCAVCPGFTGGGEGGEAGIEPVDVPAEGASFLVTVDPAGSGDDHRL